MEELSLFTFGPFLLDGSRRVVERAGEPVELSSRGFDILRLLIEARDRVLTRPEILHAVWPGRVIEEHNLYVQMSKLRQALGPDADALIATIPGRGYQFIAPVTVRRRAEAIGAEGSVEPPHDVLPDRPPPAQSPPGPGRMSRQYARVVAAAAGATLFLLGAGLALRDWRRPPPPLSIVVMPFRDLSDRAGQSYLADAISDDLITDLAQVPGSVVIARETADTYAGRTVAAREIGRTLNVRYLLEGSLRTEETWLHVNAQLIDTTTGSHVWSERFDIQRAGLAETRARIVGRIAGALDLTLDQEEAARAERERGDTPDAKDLLLRARSRLDHDDSVAGFAAAEALLNQAVQRAPDYPEAQAALGVTLLHKLRSTDDADSQADQGHALAAISRALALAPENTDAQAALAELQFTEGQYREAVVSAGLVLAKDGSDVEARDVLAMAAAAQGDIATAADSLQEATRLNPEGRRSRIRALRLGTFRLLQGRPADAEDALRKAIAGEADPQPGATDWGYPEEARMLLVAAVAQQGRGAEARAAYAAYARRWPHRSNWRIMALSPRQMAALPGFGQMLRALRDAGMPDHADEHADDGVAADGQPLPDRSFVATPRVLPGAQTADTAAVIQLLREHSRPLVLDLGSGTCAIPGSIWEGQAGAADDTGFVDGALKASPGSGSTRTIVVLADGTYGSVSYNAALRLVQAGYRRIVWYRGGEEAWASAGQPAADLRP